MRVLGLTLRTPVGTARGTHRDRPLLLVRVVGDGADGWGESGALAEGTSVDPPLSGVADALVEMVSGPFFAHVRSGGGALPDAASLTDRSASAVQRMAASALEMAALDVGLRAAGVSFADSLGTGSPVQAGAVVGIPADRRLSTLLRDVEKWTGDGYRRLRLKIEPGWDSEPVREVRAAHPQLRLQVDANGSYSFTQGGASSVERLRALEEFELDCIEQPLAPDDLVAHVRLAEQLAIPICLDESLTSLDRLDEALTMGACAVACLKPSRLGGLLAAQHAVERCRMAAVGAFVGGFFETGLGRSANAALAGLEGFTLAGDLSHPSEYLEADPFGYPAVVDGRVRPPTSPGIAPPPDPEILAACTRDVRWFPAPL